MNRPSPAPFRLAIRNIGAYAWINLRLSLVIACLSFLICLFTGYNSALRAKRDETVSYTTSANYARIMPKANGIPSEEELALAKEFSGHDPVWFNRFSLATRVNKANRVNLVSAIARYIDLSFDGKEAPSPSDDTMVYGLYDTDYPFFEGDYAEFKARFGMDDFLIGRLPENETEVAVSELLLENYGGSAESIGSSLALTVKGEDSPLFTATIVGVFRREYYELSGHCMQSGQFYPVVMLHASHPLFTKSGRLPTPVYPLDGTPDDKLAEEYAEKRVMYGGMELARSIKMFDNILTLANTLYITVGSSLIIGIALTVLLMMDKYFKVFARASGVYLSFGMGRGELARLLLMQLFLLSLLAIPLAVCLTAAGYLVIGKVIRFATGVSMEITGRRLVGMLITGFTATVGCALLFFVYLVLRLRRRTIKELLSTEVL